MDKFKIYFDLYRYQQYNFIYTLLLEEYIYSLAHDRSFLKNIVFDNRFSLLIVKRLITQISQYNYNKFNNHKIVGYTPILYSKNILESFLVIIEIPFSLRFYQKKNKTKKVKYLNSLSIHSIFTFLEDNFSHLTYVFDLLISHPIHLEIFIKIIRCWVKDASFLYLLRYFFHEYRTGYNFNKYSFYSSKIKQKLLLLLYNVYVFEYESIFIFLRNYSYNLHQIAYKIFIERIFFFKKVELEVIHKQFIIWEFKDTFMHYVSYKEILIMASKGASIFTNKWKFYLINFWQNYFYVWFNPKRININHLSNHYISFLGYISSVRLNSLILRVQMIENSFIMRRAFNKFETLVSINPMIQSLHKAGFCNVLGHPTSKPAWADLADSYIINKFGRIYRNIYHYHSGSSKKKSLYEIKYILRLSCARTLAFKHKSTYRTFLKNLGVILLDKFFMEEAQFLDLILSKDYLISVDLYKTRIWYLDIIYIHEINPI